MFPNSSDQSHPVDETWAYDLTEMRKGMRLQIQISNWGNEYKQINFMQKSPVGKPTVPHPVYKFPFHEY